MKNFKFCLPYALVMAATLAMAFLVMLTKTYGDELLATYAPPYLWALLYFCGFGLAFSVCTGCVLMVMAFLDWDALRTRLHLISNWISQRIAAKNAAAIYPCLQNFLFWVLSQNKEMLRLPLGNDPACLTPGGYAPAYRRRCLFYRFQLVTPDRPELDCDVLRLTIQHYITGELMNYGIVGLASGFQSAKVGMLPSVFLDRVVYDEARHLLSLDVLYVCTPEAADHVLSAIQRTAAPAQPEPTVFDDEV